MDKRNIILAFKRAKQRLLLLDYDGVLAPIVSRPEQAAPTDEVKRILAALCRQSDCIVVSGRHKETLDEWLGDLPLGFVAEHGLWNKLPGGTWTSGEAVTTEWKKDVKSLMRHYEALLHGSLIEEKAAALAFHYRLAVSEKTDETVAELIAALQPFLAAASLRVLHGKKVVEVLPATINKGVAVVGWLQGKPYDFILAAGDDVTDEALFAAMPKVAFTVKVGEGETAALYRVDAQPEFITLLSSLAENN